MLRVKYFGPIALVAVASPWACAAGFNPETGSYVFQQYSAQDYNASPNNWGIAQDQRGIMYFANTSGVLEFDGNTWRTIRFNGDSMAASVAVDGHGTVYVGGIGDFGFLKANPAGVTTFVSLKERIPEADRAFLHVWRILPAAEGVYFSSYRRLFRLNNDGTVKVWRPEKKFGRAFHELGALYVQTAGEGLLRLQGDRLQLVRGGDRFKDDAINDSMPLDGGALIGTNTSLYHLTRDGVEPLHAAAEPYLAKNLLYSMRYLPGGEIALGTRYGGLVLMNRDGAIDRVISSKSDALAGDLVSYIHVDPQGGVWLAGPNGITRFNPGLSFYDTKVGLDGLVECMSRQGGALYAGTDKGVFRMQTAGAGKPRLTRIDGINDHTWALLPFENSLVAATDSGVYLVVEGSARNILKVTKPILDVSLSPRDPDVVYAAGRTAVFMLRRNGKGWVTAAELAMPDEEFRSVVEDADGRVWATSAGKIWRIDFSQQPVKWEKFDSAPGYINARRLAGHVVFATTKGLKRYSGDLRGLQPDVTLGSQFADGSRDVYNVFESRHGDVWVTGGKYHGLLVHEANGYRWKPMPLLPAGIQEIYWMALDEDGTIWASGEKFVLHRWDSALAGNPDKDFHVMARRVLISGNEKAVLYGGSGAFDSVHLPWRDNALRFEFASPYYENPSAIEYQVRLEGSDRDWSEWSHEAKKDYTHLPEGKYRLRLRARSPHGAVGEDASLSFGVAPPWYRTWWAYTIYAVCSAFGILGLIRVRTGHLEEDKRRLEAIVEERTVEIREQRDEITEQERKSHALLLNILPAAVAGELKNTGAVKPVAFDDVTVCFTDFVGFTLSSEKMEADRLVDALNDYFTRFDEIIARYGLEKLKTIGDSYMFVSGLPTPRDSHAVDAVLAAIEMVQVVKELGAKTEGTGWNIRVGLHSGPVVAGVVGIRKFAFDIWGNTVNFAARMESSGVPGCVNMSERTCRLTRGLVECEGRGHVKIKEGRELLMFLARRPVSDFATRYKEEFGAEPPSIPAFGGEAQGRAVSSAFTAS
jgi:class 3 adenylate cyclase/ligand-binding sensor domain-containing protein